MTTADIVTCAKCGTKNRVPADRVALGDLPVCGRCKAPLSLTPKPIEVTDATFADLVEQSPVPVLLDLWAPWCGPCLMLAPTLEKLAGEWGGRVRVAKLNVDENPRAAARFQARSIPLMVVLKGGQEVDRLVGLQPANAIRERIGRVL